MQVAALLGVIAACGYGFGDFFGAVASKLLGPIAAALYVHIVCLIAVLTWYVLFVGAPVEFSSTAALEVLGGSVAVAVGGVSLYKAFEVGPVALVSPLGAVYPLVTAVIGAVAFGAHFTVAQLISVGLVVVGVVIAADARIGAVSAFQVGRGPALALATSVLWGTGYALLDRAVDASGWQSVLLVQICTVTLILACVLACARPRGFWRIAPSAFFTPAVIGAGSMQIVADFCLTLGLAYDTAAGVVVVSTSACYPIITMVLALRYFREVVRVVPLVGALTAVAGVSMLLV